MVSKLRTKTLENPKTKSNQEERKRKKEAKSNQIRMSGFTFPSSSSSSSSSLFATSSSPSSSLSLSNPTSSPTIPFSFQPSSKSSPFGGAAGGFAANSSSAPASIPSSSAPSFRSRPAFSINLFSSSSSAATTNTSTLSAPSLPSTPTITASSAPSFSLGTRSSFQNTTTTSTVSTPSFPSTPTITASSAPSFSLGTRSSFSNTTTTSTVSTPSFPSTPTITASSAPSFFTASSAPSFSLGTGLSFSNTTTTSTVSTPSFPSTPSITASNTTTTSTVSTTVTATTPASNLTIVIEEFEGFSRNQVYEASQTYLSTKISPSVARLRVSKAPRDKSFLVTLEKGEMIAESFEGIQLEWRLVSSEIKRSNFSDNEGYSNQQSERRAFELSFDNKYKEKVLGSYLPYVLEQATAMNEGDKVVKLYTLGPFHGDDGGGGGVWGSINLDHPSTFDTLAMDSELKVALKNDLDRFLQRKEFYKKVGKAWKRGYLLYGPPGTGKSSLIAAMANYLKFDVYDLELTGVYSDAELRRLLVATAKRSILVIEDIDCKAKLQPREYSKDFETSEKLTLSRLLNFIDGLWSSCGDERIIIFTTNHKDRLDPALLRPGRMDMHIHMSYCTPSGFKLLASNYLSIQDHKLFEEIETLIQTVDVTPAEITEELLKQDDAEAALEGLVQLLLQKRIEKDAVKDESEKEKEQNECQQDDSYAYMYHLPV